MKDMDDYKQAVITGGLGLLAALLVGAGEFLLHFDDLARYSEEHYDFMLAASDHRQTVGHFLGVLAAPLYVIGCWHIYLMLKPANQGLALLGFFASAYGFMIGADWISSRASIGALIHHNSGALLEQQVNLYKLRYESLLTVIRITTLLLSVIFVYLVLTGRTLYERWQIVFCPIVLLLLNFVIFAVSPDIGKYLMPIALNVAFGIFFLMSLLQRMHVNRKLTSI